MSSARIIIGGAVVGFVVVLAILAWRDRAAPVSITIQPMERGQLRVSVTGAVATPGVVTVPDEARLADVAHAAGGFTEDADVSGLNLAGRVGDGEHILIPRVAKTEPTGRPLSDNGAPPVGPLVDVNRASAPELEQLPGIGPVLAQRIVDYRVLHGPFSSIDELAGVQGISARLLEQLRPLITVGDDG